MKETLGSGETNRTNSLGGKVERPPSRIHPAALTLPPYRAVKLDWSDRVNEPWKWAGRDTNSESLSISYRS